MLLFLMLDVVFLGMTFIRLLNQKNSRVNVYGCRSEMPSDLLLRLGRLCHNYVGRPRVAVGEAGMQIA